MTTIPTASSMIETDSGMVAPLSTVDIIDDFERASLDHYTGPGTDEWSIASNQVWNGSNSLESQDPSAGTQIISTSGLDNYPSKGQQFRIFTRADENADDLMYYFGVEDSDDWYRVLMYNGGTIRLETSVTGTISTIDQVTSWTPAQNAWHEHEISWDDGNGPGADNDISVEIFSDPAGTRTSEITLSGNNNDHATATGIGFNYNQGSTGTFFYVDYYHIFNTF